MFEVTIPEKIIAEKTTPIVSVTIDLGSSKAYVFAREGLQDNQVVGEIDFTEEDLQNLTVSDLIGRAVQARNPSFEVKAKADAQSEER